MDGRGNQWMAWTTTGSQKPESRKQTSAAQASWDWQTGAYSGSGRWEPTCCHSGALCVISVLRRMQETALWAQVRGEQKGVREPLPVVGGLECTSVCIWKSAARWPLGSGWGFEVEKDFVLWACSWNRVHEISRTQAPLTPPDTFFLQCPRDALYWWNNIMVTVKKKCFKSSVRDLRACTEGWLWNREAIDW